MHSEQIITQVTNSEITIEMKNEKFRDRNEPEIVYSRSIKAGKRIYYIDVKKDRNADLFICVTESKRMSGEAEEAPTFEKHKVFLYKEDFGHFMESLQDAVSYVKDQLGEIEDRKEWSERPVDESAEQPVEPVKEEDKPEEQPKKRGLFGYFSK